MTPEQRIESLENEVRYLSLQLKALKVALYVAINSKGRSPAEALAEAESGLLTSEEVEASLSLVALAEADLVLLGIVPEEQR